MSEEREVDTEGVVWKAFIGAMALLQIIFFLWVNSISREFDKLEGAIEDVKEDQSVFSSRLTVIESSRCTAADCSAIRHDLVTVQSKVSSFPEKIPPQWFEEKVNRIDRELQSVREEHWKNERIGAGERNILKTP